MDQLISIPDKSFNFGSFKSNMIESMTIKIRYLYFIRFYFPLDNHQPLYGLLYKDHPFK